MSRWSRTWFNCCRRDQTCERRSKAAIRTADLKGIENTEAFLDNLDDLVTAVPTPETSPKAFRLLYIINQAPEDRLYRDESFNAWMKKYVKARGEFLDTTASAAGIPSYTALPIVTAASRTPPWLP